MKAQDLETGMPPWAETGKFIRWCESKNIFVKRGERDNWTDGAVHLILKRGNEAYNLHANCWDWRTPGWQAGINWVEGKKPKGENNGSNRDKN